MPSTSLRSILQVALSSTDERLVYRTDAELLAAFSAARDEAAFAELVRRHGRLVLGTSRRLAEGVGAAEDVFQAAFLLLAQKASTVAWGPSVGPWLYQATRRLALRARARAARRNLEPLGPDVAAPAADPSAGLAWREVRIALDKALAALPAQLRDPLVLCYLEGLTQDEAAAALGCSAATIKGRVTRGRQRLRRLLERRGLSLSAALAGPLVAGSVVTSDVVAATARAATSEAAPPAVRALLRGTPIGVKLAAGLLGLVLVCAAGVVGLAGSGPATDLKRPAAAVRAAAPVLAGSTDVFGDPLPAGAVARLGTRRLNGFAQPTWATFSPDGKQVATRGFFGITAWDASTGRKIHERGPDYDMVANAAGWRPDGTGVAVVRLADSSLFVSAFTDSNEKLPTRPPFWPRVIPNPLVHHLALSPDAARIAVARTPKGKQFTIDLLPATPGRPLAELKPVRTLGPFAGPCQDIRYTSGGQLVALCGPPKEKGTWSVAVIDPAGNKIVRTTRIPVPGYCPWQYMLSLSADARLAAVAPRPRDYPNEHDGTIRVWDLTAGKELWSLPFPNKGYGTGHAFTPDGKRLITSVGDPLFQVWDIRTGKEIARSPLGAERFHRAEAAGVAVSPDGRRFATARRDGRVDVWDTATGKAVVPLATHRDTIDAVTVSPDGRLAATLGQDEVIRVWELASGKPVRVIQAPREKNATGQNWIRRRPVFTPDGRGLLFSSTGALTLVDPRTARPLALPAGLRGWRGHVGAFAADGRTLTTFSGSKATVWDWPAGTVRTSLSVPPAASQVPGIKEPLEGTSVTFLTLSPNGRLLFTSSARWSKAAPGSGNYHNANDVWDARTGKLLHRLAKPDPRYPPAAFSPDGRALYLGGHSQDFPATGQRRSDALTAWNPITGTLIRHFPEADGTVRVGGRDMGRWINALAVSPDGRLLAVSQDVSASLAVVLYETVSGRVLKQLSGHAERLTDIVFSPDGRRLVSVSRDQTGLVWDVTIPALASHRGGKLSEAWDRLAAPDPKLGYVGLAGLVEAPAEAVRLLRANLRPAPVPSDADLDGIVRQLDSDKFAEREKAMVELERFGPNAVAGVKARLARNPSVEVRARLRRFLVRHDGPDPSPEQLRCVRAVAALEAMGTAEARGLLADLVKGPAGDRLTSEARAASRRGRNR
jgi:RNA polymerase sigma factor (sigma-70 family)